MCEHWETVWTFSTARFDVTLAVTHEECDPAGQFQYDDDVAFAREGGWHWFSSRVQVKFRDGLVLGDDYLGCCSYLSLADFIRPGPGYFRDMVREAIRRARERLGAMRNIKGVK